MPSSLLKLLTTLILGLSLLVVPNTASAEHLRDLTDVVGVRDNQLVGYGVVTGLTGTGDDITAPFAAQSLRALLRRLGVQIDSKTLRLRNVAAVLVTATIPAFSRNGSRLDITVSSLGNARSLRGGILIQTPLHGADRKIYAVAQGPLLIGGFSASGGSGSSVAENVTNTGRIPNGALIEREIPTTFVANDSVQLSLRSPDFGTANRIAQAVEKSLGDGSAQALDGGLVVVKIPAKLKSKPVQLLAELGDIEVEPVVSARVVINERTGTIVAGGDIRLSPVAIAQGGITISVAEQPTVVQPNALGRGDTAVVNQTQIETAEKQPSLYYVNGATTLADVAKALAVFGITPRELASMLQALKTAGALRAEIIVQ